ncbi:hypothetical protein TWF481_001948 [Arthrobotrys musiformis]|uniref:Uncharacterized protein n=1 Tax=Arthrobotrys musiformis TaxID=47236 RepID=A0AAV9VWV0_9PEZI
MGLAAGGEIYQSVVRDRKPSDSWDRTKTVSFNVQIFNSRLYHLLTGLENPNPPLPTQVYVAHGGVFFDLVDEEETDIYGSFEGVKTLGQIANKMDPFLTPPTKKITLNGNSEGWKSSGGEELQSEKGANSTQVLDPNDIKPSPGQPSLFKSLDELKKDLEGI